MSSEVSEWVSERANTRGIRDQSEQCSAAVRANERTKEGLVQFSMRRFYSHSTLCAVYRFSSPRPPDIHHASKNININISSFSVIVAFRFPMKERHSVSYLDAIFRQSRITLFSEWLLYKRNNFSAGQEYSNSAARLVWMRPFHPFNRSWLGACEF